MWYNFVSSIVYEGDAFCIFLIIDKDSHGKVIFIGENAFHNLSSPHSPISIVKL
ncbi:hypothetical protein Desmer_2941 [Desulfosporosinus meridiei DSM 13257]|uniref:Uncharacterized protein n=1 Tax=Desulfosporosinus meridiei (strain ATCC BAA-275 / DSM 13257 / KCTC 12902 / NCIMB 13706 / S10) TaxID=768704 RepID=J7IT21_DESMD|nr:hypothetical protein Desmer_2941 [Desulfosporosinus meridiei DSM 13257]